MTRFGARAIGAIVVAFALTLGGVTAASAAPADDVVGQTNAQRAAAGVAPLIRNATLDAAAQEWAQTMSSSGNFVHSSGEWRAARIPAGWTTNGENIAYGYTDAGAVMQGWMASDGHRANILNTGYTHLGVGYVAAGRYWVQIFAGYTAATAPKPVVKGPWPLYQPAHLPTIYELITNADGSQTPVPITYSRWTTVYESQPPTPAPTSFVKYPWSPSIYAVTSWPGGESKWQWDALTFEQWRFAGFPSPRPAGWVQGSSIFKWSTAGELFLQGADASLHKLTYDEWAATGFRAFQERAGQGYLKLTWDSSIRFSTDTNSGVATPIDYAGWAAASFPTPLQQPRFRGDVFYKSAGSPTIYYSGPTASRAITYEEWRAAGTPQPEIR